jgi:Zn-dependent M28 family amino/carboxypeptidase
VSGARDADTEANLRRHVTALAVDIGARSVLGGDGLERAEAYVQGALEAAGLEVEEQRYQYGGRSVANLIAAPPGADDAPGYLIGAHYDSVPGTPGADDNASAVAVLLELGRRLAVRPPALPLKLAAFTLEEPPAFMSRHQGSRLFARRLEAQGGHLLGAIVLEMVGFTSPVQDYPFVLRWAGYPRRGDYLGVIGNWRSRRFGRRVIAGLRANPALPVESLFVPLNGWPLPMTRLSDHASFWDRGWPALMVTDTAFLRNPNYHLPSDTIETLDFAFMAEVVRSLELAIDELARTMP